MMSLSVSCQKGSLAFLPPRTLQTRPQFSSPLLYFAWIASIQLDIDLIFQFQCSFKYLLSIGKTEEAGNNRSRRIWLLCSDSMQALKLNVAGIFHFKLSFHKTINKFLSVLFRCVDRIRNVKETLPSLNKLIWFDF